MNDVLSRLRTALEGRYTVDREIGRGGMSLVFLARDLKHDRNVAIKVLRPELTASIGSKRFLTEIKIAANLEHPNILPLFDSGDAGGLLFYTMPLVEGESLRDSIDREGPLPLDDALLIAREVGEALAYAHEQGVVHRDIKPENILLASGKARVADFGIARARTEAGVFESITDANLAIGTPEYMSPEQASGSDALDERTDIYSLGCVLYGMVAGEPPFSGRTPQAIIAKHLGEKIPTLEVVRPGVPLGVVSVIEKALSKVPADRYATAGEFVTAIEQSSELKPIRPPVITLETAVRLTKTHPLMAVLFLVAVLLSTSPIVRTLVRVGSPPGFHGRPESVVVVPYHSSTSSDREREAAVDLASLISRELNSWESIRAVPRVSMAGPMFDLGLNGPTLEFIDDGVELANDLGVQALITVALELAGESALLDVGVFDASTGRVVGRPFHSQGDLGDPHELVAPIVHGILGLSNVPIEMADLRRATDNPDALMQDMEGLAYLARWRLNEAESRFRRAVDLDSTFALALHHLAQTLYWQTVQNLGTRGELGPEIQQLTAAAVRHISGLTSRDSMHVRAFHSFDSGEYPESRALYQALLRMDSTDVYAWLMLGTVEYRDPWLSRNTGDSSLLPRGNLNIATRAFSAALRLQPAFDLGYGHLFDINRLVWRAADMGGCPGFEMPRDVLIAHWEPMTPQQQVAFCPVASDSISWIRKAVLDTLGRSEAKSGADDLLQRSLALLRRWAAFAPNEPKPRTELARALLGQRARIGIGAPTIIDSLAGAALAYTSEALALKGDTTQLELLRLANQFLGAGRPDSAVALTDLALEEFRADETPYLAANALMATGQVSRALDIVSTPMRRWYIADPVADSLISYGGAETVLNRIRLLGALGVHGPRLDSELDEVARVWSAARYSARQVELLRRDEALRVVIGLAFDRSALVSWLRGPDLDSPIWQALLQSETEPDRANAYLQSSLETEVLGFRETYKAFLHGLVAKRIGESRLAVSQFSRLDSLPLNLETADIGWGLRTHSYLLRAEAYEELGDTALALDYYERLSDAWGSGDSYVRPLVVRARDGVSRLNREP